MIVRSTSTNYLPMPADHSIGRSTDKLHVSALVRYVCKAMGGDHYNEFPITYDDNGHDITPNLALCLGLAWEDWYARVSTLDLTYHTGELELDNIVGSPDAIGLTADGESTVIHEFKLTWKSIKPIETVLKWVAQIKAYCKMIGTTHACLHIFYIHGAYTRGVPAGELAVVYTYHIEFTDDEIDINWRHMLAAAEALKTQTQIEPQPQPQEQSPPWESSTPAAAPPTATPSSIASGTPSNPSPQTSGGRVLNWPKQ